MEELTYQDAAQDGMAGEAGMALNCRIEKDGSLTVSSGTAYLIRNMYPGIDGHSLHVIRIIKEENKVVWGNSSWKSSMQSA